MELLRKTGVSSQDIFCVKINLTVGFDSKRESRLTVRFIFQP